MAHEQEGPSAETKDLSEVRSEGRQTGDKTVSL